MKLFPNPSFSKQAKRKVWSIESKAFCRSTVRIQPLRWDIKIPAKLEDVRDEPDALANILDVCCLVGRDNGWKDRKKAAS